MIKILHLSDLHIVEDSYWQNLKSLFFKMAKDIVVQENWTEVEE